MILKRKNFVFSLLISKDTWEETTKDPGVIVHYVLGIVVLTSDKREKSK